MTIDAFFARLAARFSRSPDSGQPIIASEEVLAASVPMRSDALSEPILDPAPARTSESPLARALHHDLPGRSVHAEVLKVFMMPSGAWGIVG